MQKTVVKYECDNCPNQADPEPGKKPALPKGLSVYLLTVETPKGSRKTEMDLCAECTIAVGNALGARNVPK